MSQKEFKISHQSLGEFVYKMVTENKKDTKEFQDVLRVFGREKLEKKYKEHLRSLKKGEEGNGVEGGSGVSTGEKEA